MRLKKTWIMIGLVVSLLANLYMFKENQELKQIKTNAISRNTTLTGGYLIWVKSDIENILSGQLTEYSLGMATRDIHASATMLHHERQFFAPDNRWISIASALEKGYFMLIQIRDQNDGKQPLKNEQIKQLEDIHTMVNKIFEAAFQDSNANTGHIDERSIQQAVEAADEFMSKYHR